MGTATIKVREIHCESCENTIRAALSRLAGVREVRPSYRTSQVQVLFDATRVGEDVLRVRLAELGYEPVT